ncbi:MAG: MFS transporter [Aeromonas sp.]
MSIEKLFGLNKNLVMFGAIFFLYFFIMGAYFPFFPIWLHDINGISKAETGIVFATISLFALLFQPIFGLVSDKLGLKKNLLWIIILLLIFFAPFFLYVLAPLLKINIYLGSIVGGLYIGFVFAGGAPAIEAYVEKVSRSSDFEFGQARMFGAIGWAVCASIVGIMFTINNEFVFWMGSAFAIVMAVLFYFIHPGRGGTSEVLDTLGANHNAFSVKLAMGLLKQPKFWFFALYVVGVACTYDVFDQQFANFFTEFFPSKEEGTRFFGYVTTMGELLNASIMFIAPLIVNRIGGKNALLIAGTVMSVRIIGSSFAETVTHVVMLKTLHMLEVPFLLIGTFKYITSEFDVRFSATIWLIGYQFFKQLATIFMSIWAGSMYDVMGFRETYLILGLIAATFTFISVFTLSGMGPLAWLKKKPATADVAVSQ